MGQFSWLDCKFNDKTHAILDDVPKTSYLLVPPQFEPEFGRHISETCYDEYGHFGGYDIFELLTYWNYPVKVTYDRMAKYDDCNRSEYDPNQGWGC